MRQSIG